MLARPSPNIVWVPVNMGRRAPYREKVLKLLSNEPSGIASDYELLSLTGYSNITVFRRSVLQRLHIDELVDYDKVANKVKLTRLGWLVARHAAL